MLTLVLTLAMLLSVMVVGAGAAFSDQDSIGNKEAVDMCTALNIIGGYEDGSFRPNGNVTRAEMCKMLCIVLNGGKEPVMSSSGGTYADVERGNWAEPYIEYCTNLGIVGGVGGGNFAPNGNVTGTQAAKMLLVALGFNPATEGYVGSSNWNIEINVDASQKGLYDTLASIDTEAALTRDQAAQMIWNALAAYMVTYRNEFTTENGQLIAKPVLVDKTSENSLHKITLLEDKYGVYRVEGIVVANDYVHLASTLSGTDVGTRDGKTTIIVTNGEEFTSAVNNELIIGNGSADFSDFDNTWASNPEAATFNISTGKDEIGKAITLFVRPDKNATSAARATVISHAVLSDNVILTTNGAWDDNDDMNSALKNAGLKASLTGVDFYVNGAKTTPVSTNVSNSDMVNGYVTQFIDNNDDGTVDVVLQEKVDFGKVTAYTTKGDGSITITGNTPNADARGVATDDVIGFNDVAKDDYVLYSVVGGKLYVEKATSVSGVLTDYDYQGTSRSDVENLWVDSTKYTNSGADSYTDDIITSSDLKNPHAYQALDKTATFYLDACGYIVAVNGSTVNQYALATYYNPAAYVEGSITTSARAQVTFEDGTSSAPVVSSATAGVLNSSLSTTNYAAKAVLGSYSYNSDDELKLEGTVKTISIDNASANNDTATNLDIDKNDVFKYTSGNVLVQFGGVNLKNGTNNVYMTDDTVVFVVNTVDNGAIGNTKVDKVAAYIGKDNVPSMNLTYTGDNDAETDADAFKVLYMLDGNEIVSMAVIAPDMKATSDNHMYVIKVVSTASNTKTVEAVVDNEIKTIVVNKKEGVLIQENGIYQYTIDSKGNYDVEQESTGKLDYKVIERVNTNDKTVVFDSDSKEYKITDKTIISNVESKDMLKLTDLREGSIATVLVNSSDEVLGIYVAATVDGAFLSYKNAGYQVNDTATPEDVQSDFSKIGNIAINVTTNTSAPGTAATAATALTAGNIYYIEIVYTNDAGVTAYNYDGLVVIDPDA